MQPRSCSFIIILISITLVICWFYIFNSQGVVTQLTGSTHVETESNANIDEKQEPLQEQNIPESDNKITEPIQNLKEEEIEEMPQEPSESIQVPESDPITKIDDVENDMSVGVNKPASEPDESTLSEKQIEEIEEENDRYADEYPGVKFVTLNDRPDLGLEYYPGANIVSDQQKYAVMFCF